MIEVQLLEFDRGEQKFASLEELKERIEKDKEFALRYFEENPLYNPVKIWYSNQVWKNAEAPLPGDSSRQPGLRWEN